MPPRKMQKSKHKSRISKNQKSAIVTRLLQISLEVDRYIYKGSPISTNSAQLYIDEVNGCKDKCWNDERSLQVIEKLDRLLKGIIREQQESHDVNYDAINQFNDSTHSDATVANTLEYDNLTEGTYIPTTNLSTTTHHNVDNNTINPDSDTQMQTNSSNKKDKEKTADCTLRDKAIKQRYNKNKNSETRNNKLKRNVKQINENEVVNIIRKPNVEAQTNIPGHGHNAIQPVYDKDIVPDNTIHNFEPKPKAPKPEIPNIVNINATDDLTWIENIRHVREISEEETIALLNDESFWENLTLANDW